MIGWEDTLALQKSGTRRFDQLDMINLTAEKRIL
jgi:hypothetical protein